MSCPSCDICRPSDASGCGSVRSSSPTRRERCWSGNPCASSPPTRYRRPTSGPSWSPPKAGPPPTYSAVGFGEDSPPLLDPSVPFAVHTADGRPMTVVLGGSRAESAAYALDDTELDGYVDPRLRRVRLVRGGPATGGSSPRTAPPDRRLPQLAPYQGRVRGHGPGRDEPGQTAVRGHLPDGPLLPAARRRTGAAEAGDACRPPAPTRATRRTGPSTAEGLHLPDIAWSYERPEPDAIPVSGYLSFYTERLDVYVDDELVRRVRTPWSDDRAGSSGQPAGGGTADAP